MSDGSVSCSLEGSEHRHLLFASLQFKGIVSSLLDGSVPYLLEASEHRYPLFACLEQKRSVSSMLDRSEHRQQSFSGLELEGNVSGLFDGTVSCLLEGREHRHSFFGQRGVEMQCRYLARREWTPTLIVCQFGLETKCILHVRSE